MKYSIRSLIVATTVVSTALAGNVNFEQQAQFGHIWSAYGTGRCDITAVSPDGHYATFTNNCTTYDTNSILRDVQHSSVVEERWYYTYGISDDNQKMVGINGSDWEAIVNGILLPLPVQRPSNYGAEYDRDNSVAWNISGDGSTTIGMQWYQFHSDNVPSPSQYYDGCASWYNRNGIVSPLLIWASDVSHDGLVVAGSTYSLDTYWDRVVPTGPALWTADGGIVSLDSLGAPAGKAIGISSDACVAVGLVGTTVRYGPYGDRYWQGGAAACWRDGQAHGLAGMASAFCTSGDGSVVLGETTDGTLMLWDKINGSRLLHQWLQARYGQSVAPMATDRSTWTEVFDYETYESNNYLAEWAGQTVVPYSLHLISEDGRTIGGIVYGTHGGTDYSLICRLPDAMAVSTQAPSGVPSAGNAYAAGALTRGCLKTIPTQGSAGCVSMNVPTNAKHVLVLLKVDFLPQGTLVGPDAMPATALEELTHYLTYACRFESFSIAAIPPNLEGQGFNLALNFSLGDPASTKYFAWDLWNFADVNVKNLGLYIMPEHLTADINDDGYVNVGDLQLLVAAWGSQAMPSPSDNWNAKADLNADMRVNVGDLQLLVANWGKSVS